MSSKSAKKPTMPIVSSASTTIISSSWSTSTTNRKGVEESKILRAAKWEVANRSSFPPHWTSPINESGHTLVALSSNGSEYKEVAALFHAGLPTTPIKGIDRIQNTAVWQQFTSSPFAKTNQVLYMSLTLL
jgi:hypothetical protein